MAKMLADRGVQPMHPTTVAKIEAGDRSVRINEAMEIAELFGVSMDTLLGRTIAADPVEELQTVIVVAETLWSKVYAIRQVFCDRVGDLTALDFEGREELQEQVETAREAIETATNMLALIASFPRPKAGFKVTLRSAQLGFEGTFKATEGAVENPKQEKQENQQ
jgi:hypothetical protein